MLCYLQMIVMFFLDKKLMICVLKRYMLTNNLLYLVVITIGVLALPTMVSFTLKIKSKIDYCNNAIPLRTDYKLKVLHTNTIRFPSFVCFISFISFSHTLHNKTIVYYIDQCQICSFNFYLFMLKKKVIYMVVMVGCL